MHNINNPRIKVKGKFSDPGERFWESHEKHFSQNSRLSSAQSRNPIDPQLVPCRYWLDGVIFSKNYSEIGACQIIQFFIYIKNKTWSC